MPAELIRGDRFADDRGALDFFNSLDLTEVVRMYRIRPADTRTIRAWQGHQREQKWFYCLSGSFVVNLVPLSEFTHMTSGNPPEIYTLRADLQDILRIPGGYVNGFRAAEPDSELLVFSDCTLEASKADDYRFDLAERAFIEPNGR
jgi:dTDP-4-dehydrorhamnose 3,5-epimerase